MGLRRRRKKLTSLLSSYDKRIRATTLRQIKKQTIIPADQQEEEETTTPVVPPEGTEISTTIPDQWTRVIGGFYYPPSRTGGLGQVELFIDPSEEEDFQLSTGTVLFVSGTEVKWSQTKGGQTYSGSFRPNTSTAADAVQRVVWKYGNPTWDGRGASTKPTYRAIPSGVTNTIIYTVPNKSEIPNIVTLSFRRPISSYFATTTTGTINFSETHHFVVGHILDISDLPAPFSDVDGVVRVSAVPSSTQVSFTFSKPLSSSVSTTTAPANSYAYATVSKFTAVGSTWMDSSVTPNKVYVWDGLRWIGYADALESGLVTDDKLAPAPPTNLNLESSGYGQPSAQKSISLSTVSLSWTAPTTNSEGDVLNDLVGYRIWYSTTSATGPWIGKENFGLDTSQTILGLTPETKYYFKVIAYDLYGYDSTGLDGSITTVKSALTVRKPSLPILTSRLGTIKVVWDGKDFEAADMPLKVLSHIEVHYSTTAGFTPSDSSYLGRIFGVNGAVVASDLAYNTDYYFKLIAVDTGNTPTDATTAVSAKVTPLVDADLIAAELNSPLSVWPFANGAVTAGALAAGAINAANVFGPNVVTQNAISANAIGATQIAANAITAGAIEANAITSAKISALAITADKIASNAITTDKINAGAITAAKISSDYVYAGTISANNITSGTMTGVLLRTATSGSRVELSKERIFFYSAGGDGGYIEGQGTSNGWLAMTSPNGGDLILFSDNVQLTYNGFGIVTDNSGNGIAGPLTTYSTLTAQGNIRGPGITATGFLQAENHAGGGTTGASINNNGTIVRTGSSERYKQDIEDLHVNYIDLLSLRPRRFRFKEEALEDETARYYAGFIAEEVDQTSLKDFVAYQTLEDGTRRPDGVYYGELTAALLQALQYQDSLIIDLTDRITVLENERN
jgi:hypothetical protein